MDVKFILLLLFPLLVCAENPAEKEEEVTPPYAGRLNLLMKAMTLFIMYSASLNYDAYFFTPALVTPDERDLKKDGFLDFFAKDFSLREHARDFQFSETETREQFAKRFFLYIAEAKNVPSKIRDKAAKITISHDLSNISEPKGFIRPCPLYSFVRALTMFNGVRKFIKIGINNFEVIIKFLLTEFDPKDYDIEDKAYVTDIVAFLDHAYDMSSEPLVLTDGSIASQRNKQLLQRLLVEEAVPQNVKDAITAILPHM